MGVVTVRMCQTAIEGGVTTTTEVTATHDTATTDEAAVHLRRLIEAATALLRNSGPTAPPTSPPERVPTPPRRAKAPEHEVVEPDKYAIGKERARDILEGLKTRQRGAADSTPTHGWLCLSCGGWQAAQVDHQHRGGPCPPEWSWLAPNDAAGARVRAGQLKVGDRAYHALKFYIVRELTPDDAVCERLCPGGAGPQGEFATIDLHHTVLRLT